MCYEYVFILRSIYYALWTINKNFLFAHFHFINPLFMCIPTYCLPECTKEVSITFNLRKQTTFRERKIARMCLRKQAKKRKQGAKGNLHKMPITIIISHVSVFLYYCYTYVYKFRYTDMKLHRYYYIWVVIRKVTIRKKEKSWWCGVKRTSFLMLFLHDCMVSLLPWKKMIPSAMLCA